ncbi:SIS domain-containing protein [candidate division GN15 bacterium]|nr:SIS domain-containing protein [candidate division GN15 bacterium]
MNDQEKLALVKRLADDSAVLRKSVIDQVGEKLIALAGVVSGVIGSGGRVLIAANGVLAGVASGLATELIVRTSSERNRQSLPAMALNADSSVVTAAANQYGYEHVFARQVDGLGRKGDILIVMCLDGGCVNLIRAVKTARERGMISCALIGGSGGELARLADRTIVVPHPSPQRIQEEHLFLVHTLVDLLERDLFA